MKKTQTKLPSNVWVILPGHNEEKNLGAVLESVKKIASNIIFVDDGSRDDTYHLACSFNITVLRHITNLGKGAALKTGCDYALTQGAKYLIVMDSDGQHEAKDLSRFYSELSSGKEVVFGSRGWNENMPFVMKFGNWALYKITKGFFGVDVMDTQSGFRAFSAEAYNKIRWLSNDYSMESEMIARVGKNKLSYSKIRIKTIYLDDQKGTTVWHGLQIGFNMLMWKLFGLKKN